MFENNFDWLNKWAKYSPEKLAIRDRQSGKEWNYYELNNCVNLLAHSLSENYGIRKGNRIAVLSTNSPEYAALFLAGIKIGAILVPINFRLTETEMGTLIAETSPEILFFQKEFEETVSRMKSKYSIRNTASADAVGKILEKKNAVRTEPAKITIDENDPVMVLFTSGSTGIPKGAIITHKMLFWNSINTELRLNITSEDHTLTFAPFYHTGGWNVLQTPFLHHGASQTFINNFDPELIIELIEKEKVTLLFGVPTMLQMMAEKENFNSADFSSMRYIIVGGAPMPIPLIKKWHNKGVFIRQGYGLTEVGPNCFSLSEKDAERKIGSIGFPNFYVEAKIMDRNGRECGAEEPGELWLFSPAVTPGYWNKKEETKKAITDGWFHTGDIAEKDEDGYYYIVDRKKNMFISGGENVYPSEVEKVLYAINEIRTAAVIGVEDEKWGEVGAAFIALNKNAELETEKIVEICKTKLAKYKIPKRFIFLDKLPLNSSQKIDKLKLKEFYNSKIHN
ncbi:MAG: long-chain fatty acid--CoA ligase [Chlorobi bacterium]|nr:long-chain fatty acid--CoA ligase [Chlorobiota bacterium]